MQSSFAAVELAEQLGLVVEYFSHEINFIELQIR